MIQLSEFRLGNYFLADGNVQSLSAMRPDTEAQPESIEAGFFDQGIICYINSDSNRLQPIPISDEVLEMCGFKFDSYFKLWQKMKKVFGTGVEMELNGDYTVLDFSHRPVLKEIEHLHHLQNLYFALKRKELMVEGILNKKTENLVEAGH